LSEGRRLLSDFFQGREREGCHLKFKERRRGGERVYSSGGGEGEKQHSSVGKRDSLERRGREAEILQERRKGKEACGGVEGGGKNAH